MNEIKQHEEALNSEMAALYEAYQKIKANIAQWQRDRGAHWAQCLTPNSSFPYFSPGTLPEEPVLELVGRLLEGKERPLSSEELRPLLSHFLSGKILEDAELLSQFNLALNGVLELVRKQLPEDLHQAAAKEGAHQCPICGQEPALSVLTPPVGKRYLHCTRCGHEWPGKRVGCIHCGSEEAAEQTYLKNEDFPGIEIVVCQACGGDFKEVDLRERTIEDFVWEDIRTLPLNYAAEKWLNDQPQKNSTLH